MSWSICYIPRPYWGSTYTLSLNLKYLQAWTYLRFTGDNTEAWEGHMTCSRVQLIQVTAGPRTLREGSKDPWVLGGAAPPRLNTAYLAAARCRKGKPQEGPITEQPWLLRGKQGWYLTGHPRVPQSPLVAEAKPPRLPSHHHQAPHSRVALQPHLPRLSASETHNLCVQGLLQRLPFTVCETSEDTTSMTAPPLAPFSLPCTTCQAVPRWR